MDGTARSTVLALRRRRGRERGLSQRLTPVGSSLQELLEATSRGNHAAFRALYEATAPKLFGIVLRITQNRPMAEEVLAGDLRQDLAERRALLAGGRAADGMAFGDRPQPRDRPHPLGEDRAEPGLRRATSVLERLAAPGSRRRGDAGSAPHLPLAARRGGAELRGPRLLLGIFARGAG